MDNADNHSSRLSFLFQVIAILLLAMIMRTISLSGMPLFTDEGHHIARAHLIAMGDLFAGFEHNKWLYTAVLALFRPLGPEGFMVARLLSALYGVASTAGCIALGVSIGSRRAGLLSGLLYAVVPMAVFHERQALVDPQLTTLTLFGTLLALHLARRPRVWVGGLLCLTLSAAYLTKATALSFFTLPFLAILFWSPGLLDGLKSALIAGVAVFAAREARDQVVALAARTNLTLLTSHQVTSENTALTSLLTPETEAKVLSDLDTYWMMLLKYVGWGGIVLAALAVLWIVLSDRRRAFLFLAIPALAFVFPFFLVERPTLGGRLPTRYLLYTVPALTTLLALSFATAYTQIARRRAWAASGVGILALALVLGPMLRFDTILFARPQEAPLTPGDRSAYPFNTARDAHKIAGMVLDLWNEGDRQPVHVVISAVDADTYRAYIGTRVGSLYTVANHNPELTPSLITWLADGERVFFIENRRMAPLHESAFGAQLKVLYEQPTDWGPVRLLEVTGLGVEGRQADEVYKQLAAEPLYMVEDYDTLAAVLTEETRTEANTILVFPADLTWMLDERTPMTVDPLSIPFWPPGEKRVQAELEKLDLGNGPTPIEVILVDEAHADPARAVSLALNHTFYQTGSEWYGLLHRLSYVGGPAAPALEPLDLQFEGGISLVRAAILDQKASPGGVVRVALTWQTPVVVQDSYTIFTHIVDNDGTLWAQYDSIPGGGLLPMTSWVPGEPVDDRFAIRLPPDLPAGTYTVRIGIYRPDNGLRLRVIAGSDVGPDYANLAQIVVAD
jgi:hypothetical protein